MLNQTHYKLAEGVEIPSVGFGTYLIGNDEVADAVYTAIKAGYRHIDTAEAYRNEVVEGCTCRVKQEAGGPQNASRVTMTFSPGLVAEDNKDARTVPMPRRRPSRYAISDIENPSVPVEMERKDAQTSAITASDGKRHVRVIGPQFFYAR